MVPSLAAALAVSVVLAVLPATAASARLTPGMPAPVPTPVAASHEPVEPREPSRTRDVVASPAFARHVPARTTQVVRTVRSRRWCSQRWCTVTQAWRKKADGRWRMVRRFRSTVGSRGFDKRREGDLRSPSGVYRIRVTFSTGKRAPGAMPSRRRLPTSVIGSGAGRAYNTWIEQDWRTDGDRPSMRYGFVVGYNNPRLRVGAGPRPVPGRGSGILYHTSRAGQRWIPTLGCTQVGNPQSMRWILRWLRPDALPRVVQDL